METDGAAAEKRVFSQEEKIEELKQFNHNLREKLREKESKLTSLSKHEWDEVALKEDQNRLNEIVKDLKNENEELKEILKEVKQSRRDSSVENSFEQPTPGLSYQQQEQVRMT